MQINFGIATGINGIPTAITIQRGNVQDKKHMKQMLKVISKVLRNCLPFWSKFWKKSKIVSAVADTLMDGVARYCKKFAGKEQKTNQRDWKIKRGK